MANKLPIQEGSTTFATRLREIRGKRFGIHPNTPIYLALTFEWQHSPFSNKHFIDWVDVNPAIHRPDYSKDQLVPFLPMEAVDENAAGYHERLRPFGEVMSLSQNSM